MFARHVVGDSRIYAGFLLLMALWVSGCSGQAHIDDTVVLYTSVPTDIIAGVENAFEEQNPGIDLQVFRAGTSEILDRVEEDLSNGNIKGDVIWVADFTVGEELKNKGLLLQYTPPEAAALLPTLQDPDGYYFGARLLNMVVAYNTDKVEHTPVSYNDLLNPRYRGRVGHSSPLGSGAFLYFSGTLMQNPDFGEEFFRQLAANQPYIQNNTETTEKIASGELDIGITIDYTVRKLLVEKPAAPVAMVYPVSGVVMVPSPIAIFKDTLNAEGSKAFERYILSVDGQTLLRDLAGVVPVRLDVKPPAGIESITKLRVMPTDPSWILAHGDEIVSTFEGLFGVP